MPVIKQFAHKPGSEKLHDEEEYRSDDSLWLFNAVPEYIKERRKLDFYDKVLPYADKGEDTVLAHLKIDLNLLESPSMHSLNYF